MSSYDITQITHLGPDGGAGNGDSIVVVFVIGSKPGLSNGDTVTFGMSSESFAGDNFQLSNNQSLTIGDVEETAEQTKFSLASSGTKFQANAAGGGQFQGYTGGSYSSGDFTITTGGGGGGGGGSGSFTIKSAGQFRIKGNGILTIR